MTAFVALFRAINVGRQRKAGMAELKALHEQLGFANVSTHLQTGNVVLRSADADPDALARRIEDRFEQQFGFRSEVILRTSAELQDAVDRNPFLGQPDKEWYWVVTLFLTGVPGAAAQENLLGSHDGPEQIHLSGREVYIYYLRGIGRSKLDLGKLNTVGTARNANTIAKLLELAQALPQR